MALYNLIRTVDNEIVSIFEWDGVTEIFIPDGYTTSSYTNEEIVSPNVIFNEQYGGDFFGNFFLDGKNLKTVLDESGEKFEITVVTASRTYTPPEWTKKLSIFVIGGGGAGGGGIKMNATHSIATGGAGGAGGCMVRSDFDYDIIYPSSSALTRPRVNCFIGPAAQGGVSGTVEVTTFQESDGHGPVMYTGAWDWDNLHIAGKGEDGKKAVAFFEFWDSTETRRVREVSAAGGGGGYGGWATKATFTNWNTGILDNRQAAWDKIYDSIETIPLSNPGASSRLHPDNKGDYIFAGGPGGHGIDYILPSGSTDFGLYANNAPSLPWGVVNDKTDDHTPRPREEGLLGLPWGILPKINSNAPSFNFNKPDVMVPTGGGGATGDRRIQNGTYLIYTKTDPKYDNIGKGGIFASDSKFLAGINMSIGGNGGNLYDNNVLSPTTGSGFGAGGGGGASTWDKVPQRGADGRTGAIIIIATGRGRLGPVGPMAGADIAKDDILSQ